MNAFAALGLEPSLVDALSSRGIDSPFPVQTATLPDALAGRDVCGKAPTGSGKTLAYGLALLQRVERADKRRPEALVLVPTRELAKQIAAVLMPYAKERRRWVTAFFGGAGMPRQIDELRRGVDIAVATPGRLTDLVERGECDLSNVKLVVLDEADRMADMGFTPQVSWILDRCAEQRQTLLFSATLDGDVDALIKKYMAEPCFHEIAGPDGEEEGDAVLRRAVHLSIPVKHDNKFQELSFVADASQRCIVFVKNRFATERTADAMTELGVSALAMHGGMTQNAREKALQRWARGEVRALVATDVAARGVHVDDVSLVVHVDPPQDEKDYIHRSGRTARAGKRGVVVNLLRKEQLRSAGAMYQRLGVDVTATTSDAVRDAVRAVEQESADTTTLDGAPAGEWVAVEVSAPDPAIDGRDDRGRGDRPFGDRARGDRPFGDRSYGDRPRGDRPFGDRPRSDRFGSDRRDDRPRGDRSFGDRPRGDRSFGDRPRDDRFRDDRSRDDRFRSASRPGSPRPDSRGDRTWGGDRPRDDRPRDDRFAPRVGAERPRDDRSGRPDRPWREDRAPRDDRGPRGARPDGARWEDRPAAGERRPWAPRADRPAGGRSDRAGEPRGPRSWSGPSSDSRPGRGRPGDGRPSDGRPGRPSAGRSDWSRPGGDRRERFGSDRPGDRSGGRSGERGRDGFRSSGPVSADRGRRGPSPVEVPRERPAQLARFDESGTPLNRRARRRLQFGE